MSAAASASRSSISPGNARQPRHGCIDPESPSDGRAAALAARRRFRPAPGHQGTPSFDDSAFGLAICFDVVEHIEEADLPRLKNEFERVLRPGGWSVISVALRTAGTLDHRSENAHLTVRPISGGWTCSTRTTALVDQPALAIFWRRGRAKVINLTPSLIRPRSRPPGARTPQPHTAFIPPIRSWRSADVSTSNSSTRPPPPAPPARQGYAVPRKPCDAMTLGYAGQRGSSSWAGRSPSTTAYKVSQGMLGEFGLASSAPPSRGLPRASRWAAMWPAPDHQFMSGPSRSSRPSSSTTSPRCSTCPAASGAAGRLPRQQRRGRSVGLPPTPGPSGPTRTSPV